jgi:hypothetical protein
MNFILLATLIGIFGYQINSVCIQDNNLSTQTKILQTTISTTTLETTTTTPLPVLIASKIYA